MRFIFHANDYEINVINNNTVIIYLWNVKKIEIWQAVVQFESTNMAAGYGFGETKGNALNNASSSLEKRRAFEKKQASSLESRGYDKGLG